MFAIYKRECRAFFKGPLGYIFLAAFTFIMNIAFYVGNIRTQSGGNGDLTGLFSLMLIVFIILIPLLTMRLISEEKKMKTDQLLFTAPVSIPSVVMGKFFAAMTVFLSALALTLLYPFIVSLYITPDIGVLIGNYVAIILAAGAYVAVGLFLSSLTENQLVAAVSSIAVFFVLFLAGLYAFSVGVPFIAATLSFISIYARFSLLTYGVLPLGDMFYYVVIAAIFLFLTARVFEKKRWA